MRWTAGIAVAFAGLLAFGAPQAHAVDLEQVRSDLTELLTPSVTMEGFLVHGPVDVVQQGDAYNVTINAISLGKPEEDHLEVGNITFTVTPEGEDLYKISNLQLPATATAKRVDGQTDGQITIGSQQFSGTWSRSLKTFLAMDAAYGNIAIADAANTFKASLGNIAAKTDSTESSPGQWDQTGTFKLENFTAAPAEEPGVTIASIEASSDIKGFRLKDFRTLMDRFESFAESAAAGTGTAPTDTVPPEVMQSLRDLGTLLASGATKFDVKGVSVTAPGGGGSLFGLQGAGFSFGVTGLDQEKAGAAFGFYTNGIDLPHPEMTGMDPALVQQVLPKEVTINIALEDLPARAIWNSFLDGIASGDVGSAESADVAMGILAATSQQLVMQAGSKVRINDTNVVLPAGKIHLEGLVQADPASPFAATGELVMEITGLDAMIQVASAAAPSPEEAKNMGAFFDMLRGFSNRQTGADGAVVDRYVLSLQNTGALLLNGKDFSSILGAMQPQ